MRGALAFLALAVATPAAGQGVRSAYTPLERCRLLRAVPDEADYRLSRCPGVGGWAVEVSESDGRAAVRPVRGATRLRLNLPALIGSAGFSRLGPRAEWRLVRRNRPHALIVRYDVARDFAAPGRWTSYLVAIDLRRGCALAAVPPGPGQNARARRVADARGRCLG